MSVSALRERHQSRIFPLLSAPFDPKASCEGRLSTYFNAERNLVDPGFAAYSMHALVGPKICVRLSFSFTSFEL